VRDVGEAIIEGDAVDDLPGVHLVIDQVVRAQAVEGLPLPVGGGVLRGVQVGGFVNDSPQSSERAAVKLSSRSMLCRPV
jgi:hypothetical protein